MTNASRLPAGIRRPCEWSLATPVISDFEDIIPIARALLDGMSGRQSFAAFVEGQAGEEARVLRGSSGSPVDPVLGEDSLDLVPQGLVHNGFVLSGIGVALMRDLSAIDAVLQHEIKSAARELVTAPDSSVRKAAAFAADSRGIKLGFKGTHRPEFDVAPEDVEEGLSLLLIDDQLPIPDIIAERRQSSHPH